MEKRERDMTLIIHKPCGLPVELCTCEDAVVRYDWDLDVFVRDRGQSLEGYEERRAKDV